jgi:hypothetical protein
VRIRILRERRFIPPEDRRRSIHYLAGLECTVKRAYGLILIADGDAIEIPPPRRKAAD